MRTFKQLNSGEAVKPMLPTLRERLLWKTEDLIKGNIAYEKPLTEAITDMTMDFMQKETLVWKLECARLCKKSMGTLTHTGEIDEIIKGLEKALKGED